MNKAALDTLYNHLVDIVTDRWSTRRITGEQRIDINHELFDARWCSGSDNEADTALRLLALHHDIPLPDEIDQDELDAILRYTATDTGDDE